MVPVDNPQAPSVVQKIQSRKGRNIGEAFPPGVQETAIAFMPAPGLALTQEVLRLMNALPELLTVGSIRLQGRGPRQDLSPPQTSQVRAVLVAVKTISNNQVLPTIVVQIDEI